MSCVTSLHVLLDKYNWNVGDMRQFMDTFVNREINDDTPLTRVLKSENCSIELVELMLDFGADVNRRYLLDFTPLMAAISLSRNEGIIKTLLERGADANALGDSGETCLCLALSRGATKQVVRLLLEAGCSPNGCRKHLSALQCATDYPNAGLQDGVLELLYEAGANFQHVDGNSPVCLALTAGVGPSDIKLLEAKGALLNACLEHTSPFLCATNSRWGMKLRADVVEFLLNSGYSTDVVNEDGCSPLLCALIDVNYEEKAIELLLDQPGVCVNDLNETQDTLLHLAVVNDHCKLAVVKSLIKRGAKVDGVNSCMETPLHRAVMSLSKSISDVVRLLLENGCPVNACNKGGYTALSKAVELEKDCNVLHLLLNAGARVGQFSLQFAADQYEDEQSEYNLERFKLLLKYYFIRNGNLEIAHSIRESNAYEALLSFIDQCLQEVRKMDSTKIGDKYTLHEFINGDHFREMFDDDDYSVANNQLLKLMSDNIFPIYFDVVSAQLGKSSIKEKLLKLGMYCTEHSAVSSKTARKIFLDYDCVCRISEFLSHADLLKLLIALHVF